MFGENDGDAEIVNESMQRGEDFLRRPGVECGGGFIEDEYPRMRGEHRADCPRAVVGLH